MASDIFEEIDRMIFKEEDTVRGLVEIKRQIDAHHRGCNIAKTTGTSVNAIGVALTTAGILAAPFTAGISLGLSIGGICTSLAGGGTNAGTEITKRILLNGLRDRAKILLEDRMAYQQTAAINFTRGIMDLVNAETEKGGKRFSFRVTTIEELIDVLDDNREAFHGLHAYINTLRFINMLQVTGLIVLNSAAVGTGNGLAIGATATRLVVTDCETIVNAASAELGLGVRLASVGSREIGATILKTTAIGVGVAFVLLDTALLARDWMKEDALSVKIQEIIDSIDENIDSLRPKNPFIL